MGENEERRESLFGTLMREASRRGGESFTNVKLKPAMTMKDEAEPAAEEPTPSPPRPNFRELMKQASVRGGEDFTNIQLKKQSTTKKVEEEEEEQQPATPNKNKRASTTFRELMKQQSVRGGEDFAGIQLKKVVAGGGDSSSTNTLATEEESESPSLLDESQSSFLPTTTTFAGSIVDGKLVKPNSKETMADVTLKNAENTKPSNRARRPSVAELQQQNKNIAVDNKADTHRDSRIIVEHEGGAYIVDTKIQKQQQAKKRWGMVRTAVLKKSLQPQASSK